MVRPIFKGSYYYLSSGGDPGEFEIQLYERITIPTQVEIIVVAAPIYREHWAGETPCTNDPEIAAKEIYFMQLARLQILTHEHFTVDLHWYELFPDHFNQHNGIPRLCYLNFPDPTKGIFTDYKLRNASGGEVETRINEPLMFRGSRVEEWHNLNGEVYPKEVMLPRRQREKR